jgi:predicted  nucleic acid-binding Zn-ribbon protein
LEEISLNRSMENDRLICEVSRIDEEAASLKTHIVRLEEVLGERGVEIERVNAEVARLNQEIETSNEQIAHLEEISLNRSMENDRLICEVSEEAASLKTHIVRLEEVLGERGVEIERMEQELSEKSETLDRYIHESAQMARMIIDAQDDRDSGRGMSVTAEIEEIIPGTRHEVGEHQHLNYALKGITHLGRRFSQLDVRIIEHRGNPGVVIMEPIAAERAFYAWERHGEENGRGFMLIIPTEKKGKEWLVRATTNDLLLTKDIASYIQRDILSREIDKKWKEICTEIQIGIDTIPLRLHYDDVEFIREIKSTIEAEIINPSFRSYLLDTIEVRKKDGKIIFKTHGMVKDNTELKKYLSFEMKNIEFNLKKK